MIPETAESVQDKTVKHRRCLKEETGQEKLNATNVLSAEHTDLCISLRFPAPT